jgi:Protein of unknown function (DUF4232)
MLGVRLLCLSVLAVAAAGCGQSVTQHSSGRAKARQVASPTRACSTSGLEVWLGLGEGGAAAGSMYYPLELTNVSGNSCHLFGFPGVSAVRSRQLGSPAERDRSHAPRRVVLAPGETAHTVLRIVDVANYPAGRCRPANALGLRVYPPDQRAPAEVPFAFRACSRAGPVFLSVAAVEPGVGIPGH